MNEATEPLVTAARFATLAEAQVARTALTAAGIESLVMEQDQLRFNPFRPGRPPGVRLQVKAADRAAAAELLQAAETD